MHLPADHTDAPQPPLQTVPREDPPPLGGQRVEEEREEYKQVGLLFTTPCELALRESPVMKPDALCAHSTTDNMLQLHRFTVQSQNRILLYIQNNETE